MARVVITGGLGFIGQELCKRLLAEGLLGERVREVVLVDIVEPQTRPAFCEDPRVIVRIASVEDPAVCRELLDAGGLGEATSVFHLGGIMSGQGEKDFDLCLRVNFDATRYLLEASRARHAKGAPTVRFVFASTGATFGETAECPVGDLTKLVPLNTYGVTKACCELFVNDYTRKGFIDGRSARLPTVVVRPGKPNAATTSCYSGVVREPLHGVDVALPVERQLPHAITSARTVVQNLVLLHDATWPADGPVDRAVTLPSISITLQTLVDSMHRVVAPADHGKLGKITDAVDPFLNKVVGGMACRKMRHERALSLGLVEPPDTDIIVREFLEDFGESCLVQAASALAQVSEPPPKKARTGPAPGRVAVITGAGTGIGLAAALAVVEKAGFNNLMLVGRRVEVLEEARRAVLEAAGGRPLVVRCFPCDVQAPAEVAKLFAECEAQFGRCDLLFNNAGVGAPAVPFEDLPVEAFQRCVDTNLTGAFLCAREAFRLMKKQQPRGGRIINNGSISAHTPRPNSAAYTSSKHALTGLTKSLALDGRPFGIACGQLDIGNAETPMASGLAKGALQPTGQIVREPLMDVSHAGDSIAHMASLPLDANVLFMTVMAAQMPFVGRG